MFSMISTWYCTTLYNAIFWGVLHRLLITYCKYKFQGLLLMFLHSCLLISLRIQNDNNICTLITIIDIIYSVIVFFSIFVTFSNTTISGGKGCYINSFFIFISDFDLHQNEPENGRKSNCYKNYSSQIKNYFYQVSRLPLEGKFFEKILPSSLFMNKMTRIFVFLQLWT